MSNDTNTFNPDHNWDFNFNLSGISAPLGGKSVEIPEGYSYKATIVESAYVNAEQNANRVVFKLSLQGEFAGIIRTDGLNKPKEPRPAPLQSKRCTVLELVSYETSLPAQPALPQPGLSHETVDSVR